MAVPRYGSVPQLAGHSFQGTLPRLAAYGPDNITGACARQGARSGRCPYQICHKGLHVSFCSRSKTYPLANWSLAAATGAHTVKRWGSDAGNGVIGETGDVGRTIDCEADCHDHEDRAQCKRDYPLLDYKGPQYDLDWRQMYCAAYYNPQTKSGEGQGHPGKKVSFC